MAPAKKTKTTNATKKTQTKPVQKKVTKTETDQVAETKPVAKKTTAKKLTSKKTNKIAELPTPPTKKPNAKTRATKATQAKNDKESATKPAKATNAKAKTTKASQPKNAKKPAAKPTKKAAPKKNDDEDVEKVLASAVDSSADEDSSDEEKDEEKDEFEAIESLIPFDKTYRTALAKLETQIKKGTDTRAGVIYVGRIPHKIEERDLKKYFGQFGPIAHLRIARNPLTGRPRHYAFIQYKSQEVADIVVETMDNHLFGGRLLKVKSIPKDKVHAMLFTGERTKPREVLNRKKVQAKITKQKDTKLTPHIKKRIENEMEKTQKAIKESGIKYEIPKKVLEKKTDKPLLESRKTKSKK